MDAWLKWSWTEKPILTNRRLQGHSDRPQTHRRERTSAFS